MVFVQVLGSIGKIRIRVFKTFDPDPHYFNLDRQHCLEKFREKPNSAVIEDDSNKRRNSQRCQKKSQHVSMFSSKRKNQSTIEK